MASAQCCPANVFKRYSTFWDEEAVLAELAIPLAPNTGRTGGIFPNVFNSLSLQLTSVCAIVLVLTVPVGPTAGPLTQQGP